MSLLTTEILPFETEAYHEGAFKKVTDADLKGHWSVVFFYPADFTFVCPTELEDLADHYAEFKKLGVEIYAVSTDTLRTRLGMNLPPPLARCNSRCLATRLARSPATSTF